MLALGKGGRVWSILTKAIHTGRKLATCRGEIVAPSTFGAQDLAVQ